MKELNIIGKFMYINLDKNLNYIKIFKNNNILYIFTTLLCLIKLYLLPIRFLMGSHSIFNYFKI